MASTPNTYAILQQIQWQIFTGLLINGVSPFTPWSTVANPLDPSGRSDLVKYGANPNGTITTAIYLGMPKNPSTLYSLQCHVIPPPSENVVRRAFGGKVWDERWIYVRFLGENTTDWYSVQQTLITLRDAMHPFMLHHAEMPNTPEVIASKEVAQHSGLPTGFHRDTLVGREWDCWGFIWWVRGEYMLTGGFMS